MSRSINRADWTLSTGWYGSVSLAHSTTMKEKYEEIRLFLENINYKDHNWKICVDFKMINFLLGQHQQSGYTKYPCFTCLWDSRSEENHYILKNWPPRTEMNPDRKFNILHEPLVDRDRIILPPLHIKLGLIKQFVRALDQESECFKYICRSSPQLSIEKLRAGIFDGPQVRQL